MTGRPHAAEPHAADPRGWAQHIVDKVKAAWWGAHGGNDIAVPVGVVAALALVRRQRQFDLLGGTAPDLGEEITAMRPEQFCHWLKLAWGLHWFERPDLVERAQPVHAWLRMPDRTLGPRPRAAYLVALAAIRAGLLEMVAIEHIRHEVDVLGPLVEQLRVRADNRARGDFHTPADVSRVVASVLTREALCDLVHLACPGSTFTDPTAGSGGGLRAAAAQLRAQGLDPSEFVWEANDEDPLAASTCAVNFMLWDLGEHSVVGCSDVLTDPNGIERARAEASEWIATRDSVLARLRFASEAQHLRVQVAELCEPQNGDAAGSDPSDLL